MTQERPPFRRRHYFIKKDFQFRFILKFCLLMLVGVIISTGLLFLFSQDTLTSSFNHSRLVIKETAFAILPVAIYINLITLALITLATIGVTLFVSHKLAGPMYRFEADLKAIEEGDLTKTIRVRKKDQFMSVTDSLNRMTASLCQKVLYVQTAVERLKETSHRLDVPQELIDEVNDLDTKIKSDFNVCFR